MNIPAVNPPPLKKHGTPSSLTPTQKIEIWSWYKAKRFLGTVKSKAREMNVPECVIQEFINRSRRAEKR